MPLMDTAFVIDVLRGDEGAAGLLRILQQGTAPLGVCPHTVHELYEGVGLSSRPDAELRVVEDFLGGLLILPFEPEAAKMAGRFHAELIRRGKAMNRVDLFIGCTALHHGEPVVTRNKADFQTIPGLDVLSY